MYVWFPSCRLDATDTTGTLWQSDTAATTTKQKWLHALLVPQQILHMFTDNDWHRALCDIQRHSRAFYTYEIMVWCCFNHRVTASPRRHIIIVNHSPIVNV